MQKSGKTNDARIKVRTIIKRECNLFIILTARINSGKRGKRVVSSVYITRVAGAALHRRSGGEGS
jgi:hypothetical protein